MTTVKLFDGDFGNDIMILRCNLSQAASPVEWHSGDGEWQSSQYQCADCRHSTDGLVEIGKQIAAAALELPEVQCDWVECDLTDRDLIDSETLDVVRKATHAEADESDETHEGHILVDGRKCYVE